MFLKFNRKMKACTACDLRITCTQVVTGKGSISPMILFIGEAPGAEEDLKGIPFVGRAGKMLDEWTEYLGLDLNDFAVTNLVKCRPLNNADPKPHQIEKCSYWLKWQIDFLRPKVIVPIGRISSSYFLGKEYMSGILKYSGKFYSSEKYNNIYPVIHPSYFLRQGGKGWEDQLKKLKTYILKIMLDF